MTIMEYSGNVSGPFSYGIAFIMITLIFGHLLYLATVLLQFRKRSISFSDKYFYLRSLFVMFLATLITVFLEFLFILILFTPWFNDVPTSLINAAIDTNPIVMVELILSSDTNLLIIMVIIIGAIALVLILLIMDIYKVAIQWALLAAIIMGLLYFAIDTVVSLWIFEGGLRGFYNFLGNSLQRWVNQSI